MCTINIQTNVYVDMFTGECLLSSWTMASQLHTGHTGNLVAVLGMSTPTYTPVGMECSRNSARPR